VNRRVMKKMTELKVLLLVILFFSLFFSEALGCSHIWAEVIFGLYMCMTQILSEVPIGPSVRFF